MATTETRPLPTNPAVTITTTTYAARYLGRPGPSGRGEAYTGVTCGAIGEARQDCWSTGLEAWAFHLPGCAWLACNRDEIEITEQPA